MHVGVADQRAECPEQGGAGDGVGVDMACGGKAADQRGPGGRGVADEFGIERAQGDDADAAELADAVEARHFQKSLAGEIENSRFDAQHR